MKKIFALALALVAFVASANAQEKVMNVQRTNGLTAEIPLNEVVRVTHSDSEWVSLGYYLYGDDTVGTAFYSSTPGDLCCDYYVEVQENSEQPGVYRLVNPYGPDIYPHASIGTYDEMRDYYIEINATDPDYVYILDQDIGLCIDNLHPITICSRGLYLYNVLGYSKEGVRREDVWGTLKDGLLTFPQYGLVTGNPAYLGWPGYTYGNQNNNFKLDFNDESDGPGQKGAKMLSAEGKGKGVTINFVTPEDNTLGK